MRGARSSVCRLRYSVSAVCRRSDLRPPTLHPWRLSLLLLAVLLDLCALRRAGWPTFQTPQGMGLQKVLKLLWWRRLRTLRAHDVPPVSNVPDWNTNLLTRGVQREGQHQSRTAGAHFALDLSSTHALPLLCHAPQRLLELAEPVFRSLGRRPPASARCCGWPTATAPGSASAASKSRPGRSSGRGWARALYGDPIPRRIRRRGRLRHSPRTSGNATR